MSLLEIFQQFKLNKRERRAVILYYMQLRTERMLRESDSMGRKRRKVS